jgi:hypothetical protein
LMMRFGVWQKRWPFWCYEPIHLFISLDFGLNWEQPKPTGVSLKRRIGLI